MKGDSKRKPNLRLKHERELRGWSQGDVAEKIGADAHTVYRWEHGITIPTPFFRQRLCELFNKNARELGLLSDQKDENDEHTLDEPLPEHPSTSTTLSAKPTEKAPMLDLPRLPRFHSTRYKLPPYLFLLTAIVLLSAGLVSLLILPKLFLSPPVPFPTPYSPPGGSALPTSCPQLGTARAARTSPLRQYSGPNIVFIDHEYSENGPSTTTLKSYNIRSGNITEIMKTSNGSIGDALISKDGQWILFTLSVYKYGNEQTEVQMIRIDGRDLQTIYCTSGEFTAPQWSDDQKWLIFTTARYSHSTMKVVYLLNLTSAVLQAELFPEPGYNEKPFSWLDNTRVYMIRSYDNSPSCPCRPGLYLLDINKGANQNDSDLKWIKNLDENVSTSHSTDSKFLFSSSCQCNESGFSGPSSISMEPAEGGKSSTIYSNTSLAISNIHVISKTTLIFWAGNRSNLTGSSSQNGLWKLNINNASLTPLFEEPNAEGSLEAKQTPWSYVSHDGNMYTLRVTYQDQSSGLLFGSMNSDSPTTFATSTGGSASLDIVGWTSP